MLRCWQLMHRRSVLHSVLMALSGQALAAAGAASLASPITLRRLAVAQGCLGTGAAYLARLAALGALLAYDDTAGAV